MKNNTALVLIGIATYFCGSVSGASRSTWSTVSVGIAAPLIAIAARREFETRRSALCVTVTAFLALFVLIALIAHRETISAENENELNATMLLLRMVCFGPIVEELLFRRVLFVAIARSAGIGMGLLISTSLFVLAHLGMVEGAGNWLVLCALSVSASLGYLLTRRIWLAVAIHSTWNFLMMLIKLPPDFVVPRAQGLNTSLSFEDQVLILIFANFGLISVCAVISTLSFYKRQELRRAVLMVPEPR